MRPDAPWVDHTSYPFQSRYQSRSSRHWPHEEEPARVVEELQRFLN